MICKNENNNFFWYIDKNNYKDSDEKQLTYSPNCYKRTLLNYQLEDVNEIINLHRALICHSTGLGKTIISTAVLSYLNTFNIDKLPILIVCPKTIIFQWINEINNYTNLKATPFSEDDVNNDGEIKVITYSRLRLMKKKPEYFLTIFDEAHNLKNINAEQTKEAYKINSRYKYLLSATPLKNNYLEAYSLLKAIDLAKITYNEYKDFLEKYRIMKYDFFLKRYIPAGFKNVDELKTKFIRFAILRTKDDKKVLEELGNIFDYISEIKYLDLSKNQKNTQKIFDSEMKRVAFNLRLPYNNELKNIYLKNDNKEISPELIEYRKKTFPIFNYSLMNATSNEIILNASNFKNGELYHLYDKLPKEYSSNKLDYLDEILEELDGQTIIFTTFPYMVNKISEKLNKLKIKHVAINSHTEMNELNDSIKKFQTDSSYEVFVSPNIMKYGLNLQNAKNLILFNLPNTHAELLQILGRLIGRIGQKNIPTVIYLISKDSYDERIYEILESKKEMNNFNSNL